MDDAEAAAEILPILAELRGRTGVDFSRYRTATVRRRIHNRMISVGIPTLGEYLDFLTSTADEAAHLLDRLAIKVSRFYRHEPAWQALAEVALPDLAASARPIRVWCAACGYGEEAYTLGMLLAHAGIEGSVLATDIDSAALTAAEDGRYARAAADHVPKALRERYLHPVDDAAQRVEVTPDVRSRVCFARHDLIFAAPPAKAFDLVSCRNMLIYLRPDARDEALASLVSAVRDGGYLLLGEAEWPPETFADRLEPVSRASRLFQKVASP